MSFDSYSSPVVAGHRGFKAKYTENTITGFKKCYESGATVIETDLWLTKDNVIVISHDKNTKRIFCNEDGTPSDLDIQESTYDELKDLVTIESRERLLTFEDLLKWFSNYIGETGSNIHKLQLDIKRPNPTKILKYIINSLLQINDSLGWWLHRIQFGVWDLNVIKYLNQDEYFQDLFKNKPNNRFGYDHFDIFHISVSWEDSILYLAYNDYINSLPDDKNIMKFRVTGVSLLYISTWSTRFLTKFLPLLKKQNLKLYSWTINNYIQYEYLTRVGRAADLPEYGVITDLPDRMIAYKKGEGCNENELTSELTRLNSKNDLLSKDEIHVSLSWSQRIAFFAFSTFNLFVGIKRIREEEKAFAAIVNENKKVSVPINPFSAWLFATLQKYGIF